MNDRLSLRTPWDSKTCELTSFFCGLPRGIMRTFHLPVLRGRLRPGYASSLGELRTRLPAAPAKSPQAKYLPRRRHHRLAREHDVTVRWHSTAYSIQAWWDMQGSGLNHTSSDV